MFIDQKDLKDHLGKIAEYFDEQATDIKNEIDDLHSEIREANSKLDRLLEALNIKDA